LRRFLSSVLILAAILPSWPTPVARSAPAPAARQAALFQNPPGPGAIEIGADSFGLPLAEDEVARLYDKPSVQLQENDSVSFDVTIDRERLYILSFDMSATGSFIVPPEAAVLVDGAYPSDETRRIVLPNYYQNSADEFPTDRYGNQALIRQEKLALWSRVPMRDANFSRPYPIQLKLAAGKHTFTFQVTKESILLGSFYVEPFSEYPGYDQYLAANPAPDASGVLLTLEAEFPSYKNDTSIRPVADRSLLVTPYDTYRLLLNTLGGEKWQRSGSAVYYEFDVPQDGMYLITLHALQNTRNNFTVFRRITVNGEVPFAELNAVPFGYSTAWRNVTLGGDRGYQIHLKKGANVLGIEATDSPYYSAIAKINKVLIDINVLSLQIKKLTGNQADRYKEWVISDYIPDIRQQLTAIADDLRVDLNGLLTINQAGGSQEILSYEMAIDNLTFLANDPDKIPIRMNRFSDGSGSAAQLLGTVLPSLQSQPLALDKIYIYSPDQAPPVPQAPFLYATTEGIKRFFNSFRRNPYESIGAAEDEVEVWINRPRQYVDLMQWLTDEGFSRDTGINVKFSIMPNESKLILANAAGIEPDAACGVSTNVPYEMAIRNALKNLRAFPDFDSYIRIYSPGALLSYIINDSVYAIPETQDFWVTFYRKDMLDSLGIPIPKTWNEVVQILPELQRYGMNYNTPLSSGSGQKGYLATAPYIFNFGAKLYSDDGFSTGLGSEEAIAAIKFMADSFTIYGMPIQTASFYNSFRYGETPIGISNFTDYLKLITAAPELNGLWGIDLYPATVLADGTQNRYATGSAQSCMMFRSTARAEEAWAWMKWWMSTQTQVDFQQQLILSYGIEYLWNSANVEAFKYSPIDPEHRDVILKQWEWLQEPVKLPGSYMEERELSNAWNKIVFDGVNPRVAIDNAVIIINREITRKMEEFGYLQNGVKVKEFKIPTIDTVEGWMQNDG
jgi:ABC-type glycerol-3-phosphate transport system substrate-binding protein